MAEIGARIHRVIFQSPGPAVPDGDGGYTQSWIDVSPAAWKVSIRPATAADLERTAAGSVLSMASYLVEGAFHPGVTTASRMVGVSALVAGKVFSIVGVINPELRSVDMVLGAVEVVP